MKILQIVGSRKFGDTLLLFRGFPTPLITCPVNGSRDHETSEKQVAMIAQKVVDANHAQDQRSGLISLPNSQTPTFWTPLRDHLQRTPPKKNLMLCCVIGPVFARVKARLKQLNLTTNAFGAGNTNFILDSFPVQIKQRILVSFNSTAVVTFEC